MKLVSERAVEIVAILQDYIWRRVYFYPEDAQRSREDCKRLCQYSNVDMLKINHVTRMGMAEIRHESRVPVAIGHFQLPSGKMAQEELLRWEVESFDSHMRDEGFSFFIEWL